MSRMKERGGLRLKEARINAGYETAVEFAREHNLNRTTYLHHENGRRSLTHEAAKRYASLLNLPAGTLLYGERLQIRSSAQLVGHVNNGGGVMLFDERGVRPVEPRTIGGLLSLEITAMDLWPRYGPGDRVYFRPLRTSRYTVRDLHNLDCVIELRNGRLMVRRVIAQADGRASLLTPSNTATNDVEFVAAAPIVVVEPYLPARIADTLG